MKYGGPIFTDPRVSEAAEVFPDTLKVAGGLAVSLDTELWEKILGERRKMDMIFTNFAYNVLFLKFLF